MFKLKEEETFRWPVKPRVPNGVGKYQSVSFVATFKVLSMEEITNTDSDDDGAAVALLKRTLVSFAEEDFEVEAEGDEERNALLLSKPYMIRPLLDAFNKGLSGYRSKN